MGTFANVSEIDLQQVTSTGYSIQSNGAKETKRTLNVASRFGVRETARPLRLSNQLTSWQPMTPTMTAIGQSQIPGRPALNWSSSQMTASSGTIRAAAENKRHPSTVGLLPLRFFGV